jgi:hypothetical protein
MEALHRQLATEIEAGDKPLATVLHFPEAAKYLSKKNQRLAKFLLGDQEQPVSTLGL